MEEDFGLDSCSAFMRAVSDVVSAVENEKEILGDERFSVFKESEVAMNVNLQESFGSGIRITNFDSDVEEGLSGFVCESDYRRWSLVKCLSERGSRDEDLSGLKEMQEIEKHNSNSIFIVQDDDLSGLKEMQEIEENNSNSIFIVQDDNNLNATDSHEPYDNNLNATDTYEPRASVDSLREDECSGNVTAIEEKQSALKDRMNSSRTCEENSLCFFEGKETQLDSTPEVLMSDIMECIEIPSEIKEKHETTGVETQTTDEKWRGLCFMSTKSRQEIVECGGKETTGFMENEDRVGDSVQIEGEQKILAIQFHLAQQFVETEGKEIKALMEKEERLGDSVQIKGKRETPAIEFHPASVSEQGSGCGKKDLVFVNLGENFQKMNDKNLRREINGKKDICLRRRANGVKKIADLKEMKKVSSVSGEARYVCQKRGDRIKKIYPRKVLEALRFVNVKGQKKFWNEIYLGLAPAVARELDDMVDSKNHKKARRNVDHRQRRRNKKEDGPILSLGAAQERSNCLQLCH